MYSVPMCLIASRIRDDSLQVSDVTQLDVSRSNSPQLLRTKSSHSVTSSSSSSSSKRVTDDVIRPSPSPRRRNSPLEVPTGSDVTGGPPRGGPPVTSAQSVSDERRPTMNAVQEDRQADVTTSGQLIRRRAVNLSDLRSCALVQTQMKTRKASTSWRYV